MEAWKKMKGAYDHATPAPAGKKMKIKDAIQPRRSSISCSCSLALFPLILVASDKDVVNQGLGKGVDEGTWQMVVEVKPAGSYFYHKFVRRESVDSTLSTQSTVTAEQRRGSVEESGSNQQQ